MVYGLQKVNPAQKVLLLAALWYLGSGSVYSYQVHGDFRLTPVLALVAALGIVMGIFVTRNQDQKSYSPVRPISPRISLKVSLYALFLILITLSVYLFIDPAYFFSDKVERAELVSKLFYIRFIAFTACALLGVLVVRWNSCAPTVRIVILISYSLLFVYSVIELNRELFLIFGITYFLYFNYNVREINIWKLMSYSVFVVPVFLVFKFVAYWIFFNKPYDGGILSVGELVNWSRWTDLALIRHLDLTRIQADDLGYFFTSLVYPFSHYEISSEVLFREILGQSGVGQSYGYSGPLWAYGYFGYVGVFVFYFALAASLSYLRVGRRLWLDVLTISLMFLMFRFFRQEWVIPVKTLLWVYLYPSLLVILFARLKIEADPEHRIPALDRSSSSPG